MHDPPPVGKSFFPWHFSPLKRVLRERVLDPLRGSGSAVMAAPPGPPDPQGLGPAHPSTVAYGDLTDEQQELHNLALVKSVKLAPADVLRDTPAGRRFEAFYQPLAEQYANCMQLTKLVLQAYVRLKIERGEVSRLWVVPRAGCL